MSYSLADVVSSDGRWAGQPIFSLFSLHRNGTLDFKLIVNREGIFTVGNLNPEP